MCHVSSVKTDDMMTHNNKTMFIFHETYCGEDYNNTSYIAGVILGLRPANEKCHYKVTLSLIGWAQI